MPALLPAPVAPRWYLIPARVVLVTFLLTLLSFALSLLLGIVGVVIAGRLKGASPNLMMAYRQVAIPAAAAAAAIIAIAMTVLEIRNYRQRKALVEIDRASR